MAISILSNSPLQTSGKYYLNSEDFESKLFFTDSSSSQSFIICRYDWDFAVWKVVYNGKLQGYQNDSEYQYRFDFNKYIKIEQPREFSFEVFGDFEDILFQDISKMTSKVSIVINGTEDILSTYPSLYNVLPNGEIWLNSDPQSFGSTMANTVIDYFFIDKSDNNLTPYPNITSALAQTWLPVTTYTRSDDNQTYVIIYDADGVEVGGHAIWSDETGVGRQFMFYIPANAHTIEISTMTNTIPIVIPVQNICTNILYYYSSNGTLEILYLFGNQHPIEETVKEYLTVGNNKYLTKLETTKKIKQNTGVRLTQEQVFDLIKSPYAFTAFNGELEISGRNFLDNSQSPQWSHNLGDTKMTRVLMTNESEPYRRFTPVAGQYININGMYFTYPDNKFYIMSCMVRQNSGVNVTYNVYESPQSEPTSSFTIQSGVWTKIYTKAFQGITDEGKKMIIVQDGGSDQIALDIKNCQIELEDENYIIYENGVGYMYKLEKDGLPTDWKPSLKDNGTDKVRLKRWLIDNKTFDGYVGSKLSEKNIQIILIDEKVYKRNTNVKLGFFD